VSKFKGYGVAGWGLLFLIFFITSGIVNKDKRYLVMEGTIVNVEYLMDNGFLSSSNRTILTFSDGRIKIFTRHIDNIIKDVPVKIYQKRDFHETYVFERKRRLRKINDFFGWSYDVYSSCSNSYDYSYWSREAGFQ